MKTEAIRSFFISQPFLSENACLAIEKSAARGKCKVVMERYQQVEQVIPRRQHPLHLLFRRKTMDQGHKGTHMAIRLPPNMPPEGCGALRRQNQDSGAFNLSGGTKKCPIGGPRIPLKEFGGWLIFGLFRSGARGMREGCVTLQNQTKLPEAFNPSTGTKDYRPGGVYFLRRRSNPWDARILHTRLFG